jgi:hypothetical protein
MVFQSILCDKDRVPQETAQQPDFFPDLNLDQVIDAVVAHKEEYDLKPFFYTPVRDAATIRYRQDVMHDLEDAQMRAHINTFAAKMETTRRYLRIAEQSDFKYHKEGWLLEAVLVYCQAVRELDQGLENLEPGSRGLRTFREHAASYLRSQEFQSLSADAENVKAGLLGLRYAVIVQIGKFSVLKYDGEPDYSADVERTFERFRQGAVKSYGSDLYKGAGMNHIQARILDFVARLYPDRFAALDNFCSAHGQFIEETIRAFDREIQFYIAYLEFIEDLKNIGLAFCYPQVEAAGRAEFNYDGFDLALARNLLHAETPIVCNDFHLTEPERMIVVSGPNQGGKTTFARTFGQVHYLASLGCPVPGREAQLSLFDQIFTHFEKQEDIRNLRGKLEDDLLRIHEILAHATQDSILILNEVFASTTLQDAIFLSKEIMSRVTQLDLLGVWVTFIDELASFSDKTVSMVSTVVPENPAERTFKIVRRPADGLAYALSLAEKHRLTYAQITDRLKA